MPSQNGESLLLGIFILIAGVLPIYYGWRMQKGGYKNLPSDVKLEIWWIGLKQGPKVKEDLIKARADNGTMKMTGIIKAIIGFAICLMTIVGYALY